MHTAGICIRISGCAIRNTVRDTIRYGPNRLLINSAPGHKSIYGHGANVQKSRAYEQISTIPGIHSSISTLDNARHKMLRRLLNQGLSDTSIRSMDAEMRSIASFFATAVGEKEDCFDLSQQPVNDGDEWSVAKNMARWCDFFTFDVMSRLVFGTSYNLLSNSENHYIIDCVMNSLQRTGFLMQLPEVEKLNLHRLLYPTVKLRATRFTQKSKAIMEERRARGAKAGESDVFSNLLAANDSETGEKLSIQQLSVESNLLIVAGSDTSSTTMAALFFYLSRNPSAYSRVAREVRAVFKTPDEVCQGPKLSSCSYLRACIHEALRLCPPVGGALWREVLPGGLAIPDHNIQIPAGYEVGTGIWSLNRNEKYYPEPLVFRPERWIAEEAGAEAVGVAKDTLASFSAGPRNCVGKGLAMVELMLGMAAVLVRYDFRRAETRLGEVGEDVGALEGHFKTSWAFTSLKDGPYIQFWPVEGGK
ncbi:cytochrome P450 [Aspergillus granulosus]|uniref:Cytochrome P450 n=1 Tax=Aspergillus granulosus TaxID=176169 RepID=A0ABR4HFD6_9EURO